MSKPPRTVADLRVAAAVGPRIRAALEDVCTLLPVGPAGLEGLSGVDPHLVLVEFGDEVTPPASTAELLGEADRLGFPAALWLTEPRSAAGCPAALLEQAGAVFCSDPGLVWDVPALAAAGAIPLLHAASRSALATTLRDSTKRIGLVLEPRTRFPSRLPDRQSQTLTVAVEHGLCILALEPVAADLPVDLGAVIMRGKGEDLTEFIRACSALIPGPRGRGSLGYMQPAIFDAIALGVPVIAARPMTPNTFPRIFGRLRPGRSPRDLVASALGNGEFAPGSRGAGIAAARNEHTYANRLATVASALSILVVPDAPT